MTYQQLRQAKLKQDDAQCQACGQRNTKLVVHHLLYDMFAGRLVPLKYLVTLCEPCHRKITRSSTKLTPHFRSPEEQKWEAQLERWAEEYKIDHPRFKKVGFYPT